MVCAVGLWLCFRSGRVDNDTLPTHFIAHRDGIFEEMALKQITPTLLVLLGFVAIGNGKFLLSTSPAFVSMCVFLDWASPVVAHRHGALDRGFG